MSRPPIERRVTPWKPVWWKNSQGLKAVRIWQECDGRHWYQMHEWEFEDGRKEPDAAGWIAALRGWSANATLTTEAAPGDPPGLTAEEIAHLVDLLEGTNHPLGISARAKLAAGLS
ncbi:hypothetical protein [Microcystis phage Mae-JY30]